MIPSLHCPATSSQEAAWNPKSCPEAFPSQKNGAITSSAVPRETLSASHHSRNPARTSFLSDCSAEDVMQCSCHCNRLANARPRFIHCCAVTPQLSDNTRAHVHRKQRTHP